jgi:hypothetical protein
MKKYIAKRTTQLRSIYGPFDIVEGQEVPEHIGKLFSQHVNVITVVAPTVVVEDAIEESDKELTKKGKK